MAMDNAPPPPPFKRKVFYLSGYDPRGARHYHAILAQEVDQEVRRGRRLELSRRTRRGSHAGWRLWGGDNPCRSEHEFLVWDDIVRATWSRSLPALMYQGARAYWHLCRHLDWRLARGRSRAGWYALFLPGMLFLGLPMGLGWMLAGVVALAGPVWLALLLGLPLGAGIGWGAALGGRRRWHGLWLLRFVIFSTVIARREAVGLENRIDAFARQVEAALDEDWDEVLLIAHSAGTILSVMVMARLLARRGGGMPAHFALVTLGSVIPLMACRRDAAWFGPDLDTLAAGAFLWLDIASVTDGACVPLVPPCLGRGKEAPDGLVQITPRWFVYCDPDHYARRRRDKYLTHFDYLRRLDRPSPVDYLGLVASARPIAQSIADFEAQRGHG